MALILRGACVRKRVSKDARPQTHCCYRLATIIFLISAIAFAGFRFFGQVRVQFMMVWQR